MSNTSKFLNTFRPSSWQLAELLKSLKIMITEASQRPSTMTETVDSESPGTHIYPISVADLGTFNFTQPDTFLHDWSLDLYPNTHSSKFLVRAAQALRNTSVPVAFPTETVYGLGADATRSAAVRGIYKAKQRPSDNPLIVHISSLRQLRSLLTPSTIDGRDPIPSIYHPLIDRFWPGPLTILLPNPTDSILAPEVTAGLSTFGARMPSSTLALALIHTAGVPLAAPSANASTKPSPTTAQHVAHDLDGRINIILDGGPCDVGVESTVVDGLCDPPCVLRPGGVSIDELRGCEGWENVVVAYKDAPEAEKKPRAPGMKYRHYSPKAKVLLVNPNIGDCTFMESLVHKAVQGGARAVGLIRTKSWQLGPSEEIMDDTIKTNGTSTTPTAKCFSSSFQGTTYDLWHIKIGPSNTEIARGLFSALRELDLKGVDTIIVEGIEDEGETGAAIMNRLRKAAVEEITTAS